MSYADMNVTPPKHTSQTKIGPGPLGSGTKGDGIVKKFPLSSANPMAAKNTRNKRRSVR